VPPESPNGAPRFDHHGAKQQQPDSGLPVRDHSLNCHYPSFQPQQGILKRLYSRLPAECGETIISLLNYPTGQAETGQLTRKKRKTKSVTEISFAGVLTSLIVHSKRVVPLDSPGKHGKILNIVNY
jgi:hypothetical protein